MRSRKLGSPKSGIRPTPGRVKESLFSILQPRISGSRFLDLYAGTGAIAFEAASRGAGSVVAVEGNREIAETIREAAGEFGVDQIVSIMAAPIDRALYRLQGQFDVVYADPPYEHPVPLQMFRLLLERQLLAADALVIYEHSARLILPQIPGYRGVREEVYGDVALAFFTPG